MIKKFKKSGAILIAIGTLVMAQPQKAKAELFSLFDVNNFKPAVDSTQFLTLYDADTHQKGEWNIGFYEDYAKNPLELAQPIGTRRQGVVNDTLITNIFGSYGFTDWFEAGVRVPLVNWNNYQGLSTSPLKANINPSDSFVMGDVGIDMKFRLVHSKYVGFAVVPFVNAPTGHSTTFMGQGTVTGGGKLALDFNPHKRVKLGFNMGYEAKDDVTIRGTRIDDTIPLGAALNIKPHDRFDIIAEGHTEPVARSFFKHQTQTPAEVNGAFRVHATRNLDVTAGGGAGVTHGVGSPDYRAFLGLNYTHHKEEAPPPKAPVVQAKKITIDQKIHFDFDKSVIKKESYGILDDVASILKSNSQIKRVRIEGHTDSIGSDAYNMKLSNRRANAVRDYLVNKGIAPSRLESIGYGKSRPIADNKTAAGRAQNRRTEFNVVEQ